MSNFAVITSELLASNVVACGRIDYSWAWGTPQGGLKSSFSVFCFHFPSAFLVLTFFFAFFLTFI